MAIKKCGLIENTWYNVYLKDKEDMRLPHLFIKVKGKLKLLGELIIHIDNRLIFNLPNNEASVIIPFENIYAMVPHDESQAQECLTFFLFCGIINI